MNIVLRGSDNITVPFPFEISTKSGLIQNIIEDCGIPIDILDILCATSETLQILLQWFDAHFPVFEDQKWIKYIPWKFDFWLDYGKLFFDSLPNDQLCKLATLADFLDIPDLENVLCACLSSKHDLQSLPDSIGLCSPTWPQDVKFNDELKYDFSVVSAKSTINLDRTNIDFFVGFVVLNGDATEARLVIGGSCVWETRSINKTFLRNLMSPINDPGLLVKPILYHDVELRLECQSPHSELLVGILTRRAKDDDDRLIAQLISEAVKLVSNADKDPKGKRYCTWHFTTENGNLGIVVDGLAGLAMGEHSSTWAVCKSDPSRELISNPNFIELAKKTLANYRTSERYVLLN